MTKSWIQPVLLLALLGASLWIGYRFSVDFIVLHDTARLVIAQDFLRIYSDLGVNSSIGRYFYGPVSLPMIAPLGLLTFEAAKNIWLVLMVVAAIALLRLLKRLYPWLNEPVVSWPWILLFILAINPVHNNFQSNNIQLFLIALLLWGEALSRSPSLTHHWMAGFLISLTGGIKIFPLFMLGFYWIARPQIRLGLVLGILTTLVVPFLAFGVSDSWELHQSFLKNLKSYGNDNSLIVTEDICSLPSLMVRWLFTFGISEQQSMRWVSLLVVLLTAIFLGGCFKWRDKLSDDKVYLPFFSLALSLMAFLSPATRPHYYIFYLPSAAWLLGLYKTKTLTKLETFWLVVSIALIALSQEGAVGKYWNDHLEEWNVPTYGMIVLIVLNIRLLAKQIKTSLPSPA